MIKKEIEKLIVGALKEVGIDQADFTLEHPTDMEMGDYSTNVALKFFGPTIKDSIPHERDSFWNVWRPNLLSQFKTPKIFAQKIVDEIKKKGLPPSIEEVEVAGHGFINFRLSKKFFKDSLKEVIKKGDSFGENKLYSGKSILLEHSSPNLFKPFHIGHLVNNVTGEAIGRLLKASGAKLTTITFPSDVSLGIAKAIWGVMDKKWEDDLTLAKLGEAYAWGTKSYDDSEVVQERVKEINSIIYKEETGKTEWKIYQKGRELSWEYFVSITKRLGSQFEGKIFESEAEKVGKEIVLKNVPKVFEESNGAVVFLGSKHGAHDDVFINSAGFGTYLTKDIGLLSKKFADYKFDQAVTITDIEQENHFKLVQAAVKAFSPKWIEKAKYLHHGRLKLAEGKISSRLGNAPLVEDLLDTLKKDIASRMEGEKISERAEKVAVAAIKFPILRTSRGQNMVFDVAAAMSTEGDSGVYLQYAYVRAASLLEKADKKGNPGGERENIHEVEKLLYRFPEVVERAAFEYSPHHVTTYLIALVSAFNNFYANEPVLEDSPESAYRLAIVEAFKAVMKNGLLILGIPAPERM